MSLKEVVKRQKTFFLVAAASGKPLWPQELKDLTKRDRKIKDQRQE